MTLTEMQKRQLEKQVKDHQHQRYDVDIELSNGHVLKEFVVYPKVMRPEKMTSLYLARWLFYNNGLYKDKVVIDMGSGTGIQGIVCGLYGASKVTFSDLSRPAVENTQENIQNFELMKNSCVLKSDLFENVKEKADVIVFNHPFFAEDKDFQFDPLLMMAMINRGDLLQRFFKDAKRFLKESGTIIMPFFHLAGSQSNPSIQAPKYGYTVAEKFRINVSRGFQKGIISIYDIIAQ